MRESRRNPAQCFMASAAILRDRDVRGRLHLGDHRPAAIVATATSIGGPLEHPLDVTTFASCIGMDTRKRECGLVVIEVDARACALCRHQLRSEGQEKQQQPRNPTPQTLVINQFHPLAQH